MSHTRKSQFQSHEKPTQNQPTKSANILIGHVSTYPVERSLPHLVVLNFGGGVVPGEHSELRSQTSESDEILRLGYVHGLPVDAGRDTNQSATRVAERDGIYGFLHRPVVAGAVLCHP